MRKPLSGLILILLVVAGMAPVAVAADASDPLIASAIRGLPKSPQYKAQPRPGVPQKMSGGFTVTLPRLATDSVVFDFPYDDEQDLRIPTPVVGGTITPFCTLGTLNLEGGVCALETRDIGIEYRLDGGIPLVAGAGVVVSSARAVAFRSEPAGAAAFAVRTFKNGDVQMSLALMDASSPTAFSYPLQVGAMLGLAAQPRGSVMIMRLLETDNPYSADVERDVWEIVFRVLAPTAVDAAGVGVRTWYELKDTVLTQIIEPTAATVWPVSATTTFEPSRMSAFHQQQTGRARAAYDAASRRLEAANAAVAAAQVKLAVATGPASRKAAQTALDKARVRAEMADWDVEAAHENYLGRTRSRLAQAL